MGLGMFKKHRREREAYALATLEEAVDAAATDEDREAAQAALDQAQERVEASAQADASRDPNAEDVAVPDWEPVDEARGQEPGETPTGDEDPAAIDAAEQEAQEAADGSENPEGTQEDPEGENGGENPAQEPGVPVPADATGESDAETEAIREEAADESTPTESIQEAAAEAGVTEEPAQPEPLEKPAGNASTADWRAWALDPRGGAKTEQDLDGLNRDGIRDLFA